MTDQNLSPEEGAAVANLIREELARRRITRNISPIMPAFLFRRWKNLSGQRSLTLSTLIRLEEALGIKLRQSAVRESRRLPDVAPDTPGLLCPPAVSWIEGDYLTLRRPFRPPARFMPTAPPSPGARTATFCLPRVRTSGHCIYPEGEVSIPHQSGYIYLVTNKAGQYRLIIVTRPPRSRVKCLAS